MSLIVEQMKASEGVTEELKAGDQIAWIRAMNSIHNRAEEIVLEKIVYRKRHFLCRQKEQKSILECVGIFADDVIYYVID